MGDNGYKTIGGCQVGSPSIRQMCPLPDQAFFRTLAPAQRNTRGTQIVAATGTCRDSSESILYNKAVDVPVTTGAKQDLQNWEGFV